MCWYVFSARRWRQLVRVESHVRRHDATVGRRSADTARSTLPRQADEKQHEQRRRQQHGTGQRLPATAHSYLVSAARTAAAAGDVQRPPLTEHNVILVCCRHRSVRGRTESDAAAAVYQTSHLTSSTCWVVYIGKEYHTPRGVLVRCSSRLLTGLEPAGGKPLSV